MASDAQVKEIALLRQYANRLDTFKDVILGGCLVLQHKAENILDNIQRDSNHAKSIHDLCSNETSNIVRKYENIIEHYRLTSNNSVLLGSTASDAKQKMNEINNCVNDINDKVAQIKALTAGLQERTAAYALVIRDMSGKGCEQLTKRCDILEKYKEQQI
jgi:methyl-accepting chemotaxis protein